MGGTTIIRNGKEIEEVLQKIKAAILRAYPALFPDSDVVVCNPTTKQGKIFKAIVKWAEEGDAWEYPTDVIFEETKRGKISMPLAVASLYGKKTGKGEWQGSIHLHT